jgi:hypothetical protein
MQTRKTSGLAEALKIGTTATQKPKGQTTNFYLPLPASSAHFDAAIGSFIWMWEKGADDPTELSISGQPGGRPEFNLRDNEAAFGLYGAIARGSSAAFNPNREARISITEAVWKSIDCPERYKRLVDLVRMPMGRRREMVTLEAIWENMTKWQGNAARAEAAYSSFWGLLADFCAGEDSRLEAEAEAKEKWVLAWEHVGPWSVCVAKAGTPHEEIELLSNVFTYVVYRRNFGACVEQRMPSQKRPPQLRDFHAKVFSMLPGGDDCREAMGGRALNYGRNTEPPAVYEALLSWLGSPDAAGPPRRDYVPKTPHSFETRVPASEIRHVVGIADGPIEVEEVTTPSREERRQKAKTKKEDSERLPRAAGPKPKQRGEKRGDVKLSGLAGLADFVDQFGD